MSTCPFCARIAAGEYEISDQFAVAFPPLNPVTEGHLLIVPRQHVPDAGSHPLAASRAMALAAEIAGPLGWADSYNLITSAGAPATQTVKHLHLHLVPRREGDGLALPWTGQQRAQAGPAAANEATPVSREGQPCPATLSTLPPCPTPCDDDCELGPDGCHESHQMPSKRVHQPEGCQEIRQAIAGAVAAERERLALLLDRKRAVFCRPCDGEVCDYSDELTPASELIREGGDG